MRMFEKASCGQCGKQFVNKGGLKRHIIRMHTVNSVNTSEQLSIVLMVTLDEAVDQNDKKNDDLVAALEEQVRMLNAGAKQRRNDKCAKVSPTKRRTCT